MFTNKAVIQTLDVQPPVPNWVNSSHAYILIGTCLYIKNIKNIFSKHPRGGGADSADQSLPRPHTLARWVEARSKLHALYAVFLGRGPLSHSLPLMSPAFSILIEMENLQQITTRNTAVFQQFKFPSMSRPLVLVLGFLQFMELLFSLPRTQ